MNRTRIFYGWWVASACMGISALYECLFFYGFSAFFIPWRETFGWSRSLLGGVAGLARLEGGVIGPITGLLIDKYGPRRMMFLGLALTGLGFLSLSRINSLAMLYVVYLLLLAAGSSLGGYMAVQAAVANWFVRYRGRAMGFVLVGSGIGGMMVILLAQFINTFGWRTGAVFAGILMWTLGPPLIYLVRHRPEQMGLLPDGAPPRDKTGISAAAGAADTEPSDGTQIKENVTSPHDQEKRPRLWTRDPRPEIDMTGWQALRTPAFWLMAIAYSAWGPTVAVVSVHLTPFIQEELDTDYVVAVSALSFYAFVSLFGRGGFGFLADYVNIRILVAVLFLSQSIGMLLLSQVHFVTQAAIYIPILALPYGGALSLRGVLQGYFFGRRYFGTVAGLMTIVNLPINVTAPLWIGWLADTFPDGYRLAFKIIAALLVGSAICVFVARRPRPTLASNHPPQPFKLFRQ